MIGRECRKRSLTGLERETWSFEAPVWARGADARLPTEGRRSSRFDPGSLTERWFFKRGSIPPPPASRGIPLEGMVTDNQRGQVMKTECTRHDAAALLLEMEDRQAKPTTAALVGLDDAKRIVQALSEGWISARRMACALDSTFEDMDATFAHHGLEYRIGL